MKKDDKYNPYKDESLHYTQPDQQQAPIDDRKGFNDVMQHFDSVNGHQLPKKIDHLPKSIRKITKWFITLGIGAYITFRIYQIFF